MKTWFLAILSGALLGAPFIVPALWPLVLLGLAPLLLALSGTRAPRHAFALGLLTGLVLYGMALWAIFWTVLPLDWLGIFDPTFQVVIVAVGWALTALGFALWTGVFALIFSRLADDSWRDVVYASAPWVVGEWSGAWWFGIQNAGPGYIPGPHFTLPFIGNVLAHDSALVQLAWLGGVYALSFACAAGGALVYRLISGRRRERRVLGAVCIAAFALWLVGHGVLARTSSFSDGRHVRIAVVSTQTPAIFTPSSERAVDDLARITEILPRTRGADIVVVPEGTDLIQLLNEPSPSRAEASMRLMYEGTASPTFVDSGNAYSSYGTLRLRTKVYNIAAGTFQFQDKRFLLPDGEYVPAYVRTWVTAVGRGEALNAVLDRRGMTPGDDIHPLAAASTTIGVLFCDEAMSPVLYRSLALQGAGIFVNAASYAWFHGSRLVADQMRDVGIVRAVESRRWYVQASNIAPSFVLDPYGRVATSSSRGMTGVVVAEVEVRHGTTPYDNLGAWFIWASAGMVIAGLLRRKCMRQ